jgi:molybdopterin adenylyltransferase
MVNKQMFTVGIITASDKGSKGEREDRSGIVIKEMIEAIGYEVKRYIVLPDEKDELEKEMIYQADNLNINLIFTTGGTGFSKRDVTPEATKNVITREANGIAEAIRYYSLQITPRAMLSRAVSGIRGDSLIINLPGSPKAVKEALEFILETTHHGLEILLGRTAECARK